MSKREREREKKDIRRYDWKKERDRERGGKRGRKEKHLLCFIYGVLLVYIYIENYKKFYELIDFLLPIFFFFVIAL